MVIILRFGCVKSTQDFALLGSLLLFSASRSQWSYEYPIHNLTFNETSQLLHQLIAHTSMMEHQIRELQSNLTIFKEGLVSVNIHFVCISK